MRRTLALLALLTLALAAPAEGAGKRAKSPRLKAFTSCAGLISYATNADRLAFASDAANLSSSDRNGATDVYQRSMSRRYGKKIKGRRVQYLRMETKLVSDAKARRSALVA